MNTEKLVATLSVGDLVKLPPSRNHWWSDQVGIIDIVESKDSPNVMYRVFIPSKGTARFSQTGFVELLSEAGE